MTLPRRDGRPWSGARQPTREETSHATTELNGVVAEHVAAVNAFDIDAIVATFAGDAYVNDARREITGADAIRAWVTKEMVGDHVTMDVREVVDHYGDIIVRARYDGTFDKTNLPDELVMSTTSASATARSSAWRSSSTSRRRTNRPQERPESSSGRPTGWPTGRPSKYKLTA